MTPLLWLGYIAATAAGLTFTAFLGGLAWFFWRAADGWLLKQEEKK